VSEETGKGAVKRGIDEELGYEFTVIGNIHENPELLGG
jgi:hypothetical protein